MKIQMLGDTQYPPLVLVHGWGFGSAVWQPLLERLQQHFYLLLIDLPGYGESQSHGAEAWDLDRLMDQFANRVTEPAIWCGWSLGGMLSANYAAVVSEQVKGLICIASNPLFVMSDSWSSAMDRESFAEFSALVKDHPRLALNRFAGLVAQGSISGRSDLRRLKQLAATQPIPGADCLASGLQRLHELDVRGAIEKISVPQCHIFGEVDALVPMQAAEAVSRLNHQAQMVRLPQASHIPWLSNPDAVMDAILQFASCNNE